MNQALKKALRQQLYEVKFDTQKLAHKTKFLFTAIFGWLLMVVAAPYIAMNIPEQAPTLFTSLFVCFIFILGAAFIQMGVDGLEKANKEKNAGDLLNDLELGTKEEGKLMMDAIKARSH